MAEDLQAKVAVDDHISWLKIERKDKLPDDGTLRRRRLSRLTIVRDDAECCLHGQAPFASSSADPQPYGASHRLQDAIYLYSRKARLSSDALHAQEGVRDGLGNQRDIGAATDRTEP